MEAGTILGLTVVLAGTNVVLIGIMFELRRIREAIKASREDAGGSVRRP
jgi:hypothetical protein